MKIKELNLNEDLDPTLRPDELSNLIDELEEQLEQVIYTATQASKLARRTLVSGPVSGQIDSYLIPWMKSFINDKHQPGSLAALRRILERE